MPFLGITLLLAIMEWCKFSENAIFITVFSRLNAGPRINAGSTLRSLK